jgi:hypothetical protein
VKAMKNEPTNNDEMVDYFQSLSAMELKEVEKKSIFLFRNDGEYPDNQLILSEADLVSEQAADYYQNLTLVELRNIKKESASSSILSLEEKAAITGLEKWVILKLETQKENATLKEIMTYCSKLNIPYYQFLPEISANFYR